MNAPAGSRTCSICHIAKTKENFQPQGRQCRECRNAKQQAYWASLPEDVRKQRQHSIEYQRNYRLNNKEKVQFRSRREHLMRKFGLTLDDYEKMAASQNNVCAICFEKCATGNSLAVDHCHETNVIRGLLCKNCNTAIGLLMDNTDNLFRAISYLERYKKGVA